MMLADHPHVQGLLLGVAMLAAAAAATPAAWNAVRDLGDMRPRAAQPAPANPAMEPTGPEILVASVDQTG